MLGYGKLRPSRDHVQPKARGGRGSPTLICCARCNSNKGDKTLEEWAVVLTKKRDARALFVRMLADQLANGTLMLVPEHLKTEIRTLSGLAPGIFS